MGNICYHIPQSGWMSHTTQNNIITPSKDYYALWVSNSNDNKSLCISWSPLRGNPLKSWQQAWVEFLFVQCNRFAKNDRCVLAFHMFIPRHCNNHEWKRLKASCSRTQRIISCGTVVASVIFHFSGSHCFSWIQIKTSSVVKLDKKSYINISLIFCLNVYNFCVAMQLKMAK